MLDLDPAFEALKTFDYGMDRHVLDSIDGAAVTTRNDPAARKDLESRLVAVLPSTAPHDAKDFVCRVLRIVGTADAVPALEALLADADISHMARYALERIPDPKAGQALERQLRAVSGPLKIGIIGSLGTRGEGVSSLRPLLLDPDEAVARAAAIALGHIGSADASKALSATKPTPALAAIFANASLECGEKLLKAGHAKEAKAAYQALLRGTPSPIVRAAAERGLKASEPA